MGERHWIAVKGDVRYCHRASPLPICKCFSESICMYSQTIFHSCVLLPNNCWAGSMLAQAPKGSERTLMVVSPGFREVHGLVFQLPSSRCHWNFPVRAQVIP